MGHYEASTALLKMGVISGGDITTEAALAKMMFVLGNYTEDNSIKKMLNTNLRGGISTQ